MKKMSSLLALSMSACIAVFLITTDAKAQKTQDRMPSPPGGRGGLPDGVTSRAPRGGEVFNDRPGSAESRKTDRWQRDNDGGSSGGSAASRKQDRLTPSPNAVNNPDRRVRTATGYGYGPRSRTPKIQDRLTPDRNYNGPETIYRYGGRLASPPQQSNATVTILHDGLAIRLDRRALRNGLTVPGSRAIAQDIINAIENRWGRYNIDVDRLAWQIRSHSWGYLVPNETIRRHANPVNTTWPELRRSVRRRGGFYRGNPYYR